MDQNNGTQAPRPGAQQPGTNPGGSRSPMARVQHYLQQLVQKIAPTLRRLGGWLRRPRVLAGAGAGAAVLVAAVLFAVPRGPEEQQRRLELSGKDLFLAIVAQQPGAERSSRVREGDERGSGTNLIVLSETTWETLSIDQRNSLGSWLNSLGGRWEIRVGRGNEDQTRVLDAQPTITSDMWNQQLK